jgi:hypothetical protein
MDQRELPTASSYVADVCGADFVGSYRSTVTPGIQHIDQTDEWGRSS